MIDAAEIAPQRFRGLGRFDHQLEMSEHALQRVVHLVRDAGDELAERGELLRLSEPLAQRFALAFEASLMRDVASHQH